MSFRNTLILAVLVAVLGAYLWFVERPAVESESEQDLVLEFEPERIARIELAAQDGTSVEVVRQGEEWRLTKPVAARADQQAVQSLLKVAAEAEQKKTIEKPGGLAQYGLEPPATVIRLTRDDGSALPALAIGKNAPIGFNAYLRRGDEPSIVLSPATVRAGLEKKADDLRDKTVIEMSEEQIERITIEPNQGERVVLAKAGSDWRITEPIQTKADATGVRALLGSLRGLRAAGFVDASGELVRETHGLTTPRLVVTLASTAEPKERRLLIGNDHEDASQKQVYVESMPGGQIFLVGSQTLQSLSKNAQNLRDKTVVAVDPERLARVDVARTGQEPYSFEKEGETWRLGGANGVKSKDLLVRRYLDDVRGLVGDSIVSESGDRSAYGLNEPLVEITLSAADGEKLGVILLGATGEGAERKYYAAAPGDGPVFELRDYVFRRFDKPRDEFIQSDSKAADSSVPADDGGEPPVEE